MQGKVAFPLGFVSPSIRPYLELIRLEKPTGTALMFWPFAWGLTLGAFRTITPFSRYVVDLLCFLLGAAMIRGAACTVNDILDRKFDAAVERTKSRPLPSRRVSVSGAFIFLVLQYVIVTMYFTSLVSRNALIAMVIQLFPLLSIYPLLKRFTNWPQAYLGFGMNFGLVVSWIHISDNIDIKLLGSMLAACWCWTMQYDTIYACQDRKDDLKVGVHSTAVLLGEHTLPFLKLNALAFVGLLTYVGYLNRQGPAYYLISCFGTACWLIHQFTWLDLDSTSSCWAAFRGNGHLGWMVWAGLSVDFAQKLSAHR